MRNQFRLTLAFILMLSLGSLAVSQDKQAKSQRLWLVQNIQVELTQEDVFEQALQAQARAFQEAKLGREHLWVVSSRPMGRYTISYPLQSFADLDRFAMVSEAAEKAIGKGKWAEWETKKAATIRSVQNTIYAYAEELSYHPKKSARTKPAAAFYHWTIDYVKPAYLEQYKQAIKAFAAALEQANHPLEYEVYEVLFGSESAFVFAYPADNAEQHYSLNQFGPIIAKAIGREAAASIYVKWRECLSGFEALDTHARPDLSFLP